MFKGVIYLIKICWRFDKVYVVALFSQQIINAISSLMLIIIPKFIIDELVGNKDAKLLTIYCVTLISLYFISSVISNILSKLIFTHKISVFNEFQVYLSTLISSADYEQLEDNNFLDLKEKAYKFLYANGSGFAQILDNTVAILGKFIFILGLIGIIATFDLYMVALFIVLTIFSVFIDAKMKKKNIQIQLEKVLCERKGQYFLNLFSDFSFGKEIRVNNLSNWLISKYKIQLNENEKFYKKMSKNNIHSANFNSVTILVQQLCVYAYLVYKALFNLISIGDFSMYIQTVNNFSATLKGIISDIVDVQQYRIYYEEFRKYIDIKNDLRKGTLKPDFSNGIYEIKFKNVSFRYKNQENYALKNVTLTISPNEKLAIVGENGAGKTTFVKLLSRLYDPTEGEILLNGINIKDIDYDYYMNLFSVIYQDFKLFSFTIRDNICLDKSNDIDDLQYNKILKQSGIHKKIESLPYGSETYIYKNFSKHSFEPSGGEGQKIALSRALIKDAPYIILDEPTAALDPRAEHEMYSHFSDLVKNKVAIYISHRLSSTKFCDKIAVFKNGRLIEYGSHSELIIYNSYYNELFTMQAKYYK
ncbi:ABC transporter ATP-binding protein [Bacillus cereus]|nr:ABC transporter ATP-binding protein [Bacillus cereus]